MFEELRAAIATALVIDPGQIALDTRFEDLGLDSLNYVGLSTYIKDRFHVVIDDTELEELGCLDHVLKELDQRCSQPRSEGL